MPTGIYLRKVKTIPPNQTGKHWKLSEKTKKKLSLAHKGMKKPWAGRYKHNPLSDEHKRKIKEALKGRKRPPFSRKTKRKMSLAKIGKPGNAKGKKWSLESRERRRGEGNPNWRGGRSKKRRSYHSTDRNYIEWRKEIFEYDNYTCWICEEKSGNGYRFEIMVHHLYSWAEYPKLRYSVRNGITLCKECHKLYGYHNNKLHIPLKWQKKLQNQWTEQTTNWRL